ncbi:5780_t:CDS:1, partial [Racocetra persica]
ENTKPQSISTITLVKCYIDIQDCIYPAIIDSEASVNMISYQTVKKPGLKIEELSKSLIVATTSTTSRPLRIIRNLLIRIQDRLIPLDIEVVPATSYSILLENDWSKKIKANYN